IATDVAGRSTTRSLGATYGVIQTAVANTTTVSDANYRARRVTSDGAFTAVTSGSAFGTGLPISNKFLLYQGANAAVTPTVVNGTIGPIQDAVINSGYLYLAGDRLATINLSDPTLAMHLANSDPFGAEAAVAVSGGFAFGAEINNNNDGRINIYNVSSPGAPLFVRQQAVAGVSGLAYRALVPLGANYLIAITPDRPCGGDY